MKFQIIVEYSGKDPLKNLMPDDEFEKLVRRSLKMPGFNLLGARSLEGIQARVWEPIRREKRIYRDPLE